MAIGLYKSINLGSFRRHSLEKAPEAATRNVLYKKVFLMISQFHRKTPVLESLFDKVADLKPWTLLKRDSKTGVLLWNLRNFSAHLFWRTSANDCASDLPKLISLVLHMFALNMLQYIKLVWKRRINRIFHRNQANSHKVESSRRKKLLSF